MGKNIFENSRNIYVYWEQKNDLRDIPGNFYCKRASCILQIEVCIKRQQANLKQFIRDTVPFLICLKCKQGERNIISFKKEVEKLENKNTTRSYNIKEVVGDKRICMSCGENKTIQPNNPYCSKCLNRMSQKVKKEKKMALKVISKPEKVQKSINSVITIDFGKHAHLINMIKDVAEVEMRHLNSQIIYMLKYYLETKAFPGDIKT